MYMKERIHHELIRLNFQRTKTMIQIVYIFILYTVILNIISAFCMEGMITQFYKKYSWIYLLLLVINSISFYLFKSKKCQPFFTNVRHMKIATITYNALIMFILIMITTLDAVLIGHIMVFEVIYLIAVVLYFTKCRHVVTIAVPLCIYMIVLVLSSDKLTNTYSLVLCGNIIFLSFIGIIASQIVYKNKRHAIMQKLLLEEKNVLNENLMVQLKVANEELQTLMMRDPMTNVWNRRAFDEFMCKTAREKTDKVWTFFLLDIDFFKQYNDYYGHQKGDEVLILIAHTLQHLALLNGDFIVRWGGEEFMYVTCNDREETSTKIIDAVKCLAIPHERSFVSSFVTVSVGGYSTKVTCKTNIVAIYELADKALYNAKEDGRNQVQFC